MVPRWCGVRWIEIPHTRGELDVVINIRIVAPSPLSSQSSSAPTSQSSSSPSSSSSFESFCLSIALVLWSLPLRGPRSGDKGRSRQMRSFLLLNLNPIHWLIQISDFASNCCHFGFERADGRYWWEMFLRKTSIRFHSGQYWWILIGWMIGWWIFNKSMV